MSRAVMLSNGSMVIGLNEQGLVNDFYYPYVGMENLCNARISHHKIGVWVDGAFHWLDDGSWEISASFEEDALISNITAKHPELKVQLYFQDFVDIEVNAFCRQVEVTNLSDQQRDIRVFFHQVFQISNSGREDTALFVPKENYIYDYKGPVSLLIYAQNDKGEHFDQFAVGNYGIENKEGTFKDAEDGELSNNLVEHSSVDSVLRCQLNMAAGQKNTLSYWVIAHNSQTDAEAAHQELLEHGVADRLNRARYWWQHWLSTGANQMHQLDKKYLPLFKKSLMVIKAHIDDHGGIIASCDSSIYNYGRDYYSYVWPRDGALTLLPLIELGYFDEAKNFFNFCIDTMHRDGYMMHKYQPDRSIGSTWHPLVHKHHPELAIQEDETASVIYALGRYLDKSHDVEYIKANFNKFIRPAGNFMAGFIHKDTNLPHASYDLWEEKFATHTYTAAVTLAALNTAAGLANVCGRSVESAKWRLAAARIEEGMKLLFNPEMQCYRKSLLTGEDGNLEFDNTVDISSAFGVFMYDSSRAGSGALSQAMEVTEQKLMDRSPTGGVARYVNDQYFLEHHDYPGNPWYVCTLWMAQYYVKSGKLDKANAIIDWVIKHKTPSDLFSEQLDPVNGQPLGVTPLVWSHAEFINTLLLMHQGN